MCILSPNFLDLFVLPSVPLVLVLGCHRGPGAIILVIVGADSNVTWQVGTAKENAAAKLQATVARDLTARVRSKQLSILRHN